MAQPMPESVKVAPARLALDTGIKGVVFPMKLGVNEVAILLSLYYAAEMSGTAGYNILRYGLWRKSDTDPAAMEDDHTDMIWETADVNMFITESISFLTKEHVVFPWPLTLIRAPRLVGLRSNTVGGSINMRLYYLTRTVKDEDLAKLMVKDHA